MTIDQLDAGTHATATILAFMKTAMLRLDDTSAEDDAYVGAFLARTDLTGDAYASTSVRGTASSARCRSPGSEQVAASERGQSLPKIQMFVDPDVCIDCGARETECCPPNIGSSPNAGAILILGARAKSARPPPPSVFLAVEFQWRGNLGQFARAIARHDT